MAQEPPSGSPPVPTGRITGRVFCTDTGQPGRFAGVQLIPEKPEQPPAYDKKNPLKAFEKGFEAGMKGSNTSAMTALDGTFSLDKVPPGTYYVVVQLPGYTSP